MTDWLMIATENEKNKTDPNNNKKNMSLTKPCEGEYI